MELRQTTCCFWASVGAVPASSLWVVERTNEEHYVKGSNRKHRQYLGTAAGLGVGWGDDGFSNESYTSVLTPAPELSGRKWGLGDSCCNGSHAFLQFTVPTLSPEPFRQKQRLLPPGFVPELQSPSFLLQTPPPPHPIPSTQLLLPLGRGTTAPSALA